MSKDKYHNIDDLMGDSEAAAPEKAAAKPPVRQKRPSPALGAATGVTRKPTRSIDAVKEKAEKELQEATERFEAEKKALLDKLEKAQSRADGEASPIILTMPVTKQEVSFELRTIDPGLIDVSPENERIQDLLDEISLQDILPSIRKHGQQKPGTVRPKGDGRFELIEGSRRKAAVALAGKPYLALVGDVPDADVRELSVIENKHKDVSPYEKAMAYQKQIENEEYENWTQLGAAKGISSSHISRYRACVQLEEKYVRILPSPSDMPLSYGETISGLMKKGKSLLDKKVNELLEMRSKYLTEDVELLDVEQIIKELKSSVRTKSEGPTAKKPITYKSQDGKVNMKHSLSNSGSTKFELQGVPKDKLDKIKEYLVTTLKLEVK